MHVFDSNFRGVSKNQEGFVSGPSRGGMQVFSLGGALVSSRGGRVWGKTSKAANNIIFNFEAVKCRFFGEKLFIILRICHHYLGIWGRHRGTCPLPHSLSLSSWQ